MCGFPSIPFHTGSSIQLTSRAAAFLVILTWCKIIAWCLRRSPTRSGSAARDGLNGYCLHHFDRVTVVIATGSIRGRSSSRLTKWYTYML